MSGFWQAMRSVRAERARVLAQLDIHHAELRQHGRRLHGQVDTYLGTPKSLVHGFLAGFLLDQTRPLVPQGPSPLKLLLPLLLRLFP